MKNTQKAVAIALLMTLPMLAEASNLPGPGGTNSWTIYAFANTTILQGILQSSSALIANQSFRYLLEFLAMIGFLGSVIGLGMFGGDLRKLAWPAVASTVFLTVGIGTTTNVTIQDTVVTGTAPTVAVVTNVPIIVALPESIVSTMGHQLAYLLDTFYSLPNQLTVTGGSGFNLAAALVRDSTKISIPDPLVRASLASYAQNCVVPSLAAGTLSPYLLTTATQLWGTTTAAATAVYPCGGTTGTSNPAMMCVNPSLMTVMYSDSTPGGVVLPCAMPNGGPSTTTSTGGSCSGGAVGISSTTYNVSCAQTAYDYLNQVFYNGAPNWFQQGAGAWASTGTYSWLGAELTSAQNYLFGGTLTQSTGATIEQAAAINAMSPALQSAAIASGQSQMVTSLAVAQAETSQVTSWATAVNLFQDLSGYIYSVLQAFLVAMTPIVLAAAFMPGAGIPMVKSYMKITIWLALWMPVLSIINFIVSLYGAQEMTGVFGSGTGGYSMQSMAPISQLSEHLVLAAGFLATLTPLITWALVNGSFAFTEFLAEGLGGRMASMAGSMAATGNVSLGNQSFNNTSMNQAMMATSTVVGSGAAQVMTNDGGVQMTNAQGGAVARNAAGISASRSASALDAQGVSRQESIARGATVSASRNEEAATSAATQADKTLQNSVGSSSDAGTRLSADESARLSKDVGNQIDYAQRTGVLDAATADKAKTLAADASLSPTAMMGSLSKLLGGGGKGMKSVGGMDSKLTGNVTERDGITHRDSNETSTSTSDKSGDSASLGRSALLAQMRSTVYSAQASAAERVSSTAAEQYRSAAGLSQQASQSYQDAAQATRRLEQSSSESGTSAYDTTRAASDASKRVAGATASAPSVGAPLPDASTLSPAGGDLTQRVSSAVPSSSALPQANGNAVAAAGETAQRQADGRTSDAQAPLRAADSQLSNFDEKRQEYSQGLAGAQGNADRSADSTKGAAGGKVAAVDAKTDLGKGQVTDTDKFNERNITGSTNSANPFNVTAPASAEGFGEQSAVLLGGTSALKGAAEGAANYQLLKSAASKAGTAEATAATAETAGAAPATAASSAPSVAGAGASSGAAAAETGAVAAEATTVGTTAAGGATVTTGTGVAAEGTGALGIASAPVAIGAAVVVAAGVGSKYLYENNPKYASMLNSLYVKMGDDPKKYAPLPEAIQLTPSPDLRSAGRMSDTSPNKLTDSEAIKTDAVRKEQEAARRQ